MWYSSLSFCLYVPVISYKFYFETYSDTDMLIITFLGYESQI